ncbi:MAG: DUF1553 domain-containing protein, partial [Planctomycetes bacterium]|nr:DUF1553 domain-containing protein [Planctomycetota bacterium]
LDAAKVQRRHKSVSAQREVLEHELAMTQTLKSLMTVPELRQRSGKDFAAKEAAYSNSIAARKTAAGKLTESQRAESQKSDDATYTSLTEVYPVQSSGRRTALARWIVDSKNPLTARVAVNHVWLRHFGQPLVESIFDFGHNGRKPTHPELLDWLAVEFLDSTSMNAGGQTSPGTMRAPFELKRLHRLLVTSSLYRRASTRENHAPSESLSSHSLDRSIQIDPDNRLYWRMNARRLEAESVRDAMLWIAGHLDDRLGGPELESSAGLTTNRRSLYYRHAPEKSMEFLSLFDVASPNECYRRNVTVVPQQALALANSSISFDMSRRLATELSKGESAENLSDGDFLNAAFQRILCRVPTDEELSLCREFLMNQPSRLGTSEDIVLRSRMNLVHVLINHNDFVTVR